MTQPTMIQQVSNAIGAHGMWKMRLKVAIKTGTCDVSPAVAGCDDQCAFGKWLYSGEIDRGTKSGMPYQVVKRLHADFHRHAGRVLSHVQRGEQRLALATMDGDYAAASDKLVRALSKWKGELSVAVGG